MLLCITVSRALCLSVCRPVKTATQCTFNHYYLLSSSHCMQCGPFRPSARSSPYSCSWEIRRKKSSKSMPVKKMNPTSSPQASFHGYCCKKKKKKKHQKVPQQATHNAQDDKFVELKKPSWLLQVYNIHK